jgi:hypothetical protein
MPANEELTPQPESDDPPAGVDLEELARKVFEILLQELEIESDRIGKSNEVI